MKLSYKIKVVLAMAALILVVTFASLILSRQAVQHNFANLLNKQFEELTATVTAARQQELEELARTVADSAVNPRLTAAFEMGRSDDFERFYYDLSEELEEVIQRFVKAESFYQPFFRFIDYEGNYLSPPPELLQQLGMEIPLDEDMLAPLFQPLASGLEEEPEPRSGYTMLPTRTGERFFEMSVIPIHDGMGYLMGELVFAIPFDSGTYARVAGSRTVVLYLNGKLAGGDFASEDRARLIRFLEAKFNEPDPDLEPIPIEGEHYNVFTKLIQRGAHFPPAYLVTLFSTTEEAEILHDIEMALLGVSGLALILGLILSLAAAQRLARRISTLVEATRQIARGDFEYRVKVAGGDEISMLGNAFNEMSQDLSLKEKYRAVLDKVTDKRVAEELTSGSIELGGEEREVTILFCDIRQFTPLTRSKHAREIVELLNEHMTALTRCVIDHEGVVDKFVGDEIMVLFGAPHSREDDARRAVECAIDILTTRRRMNIGAETPIEVGIGIATGRVIAGCMGSEDRLNYTVIGNGVNLAARLCGKAVAGQVLFDESTARRLTGMEALPTEPVQLKGFTSRLQVYTVDPARNSNVLDE